MPSSARAMAEKKETKKIIVKCRRYFIKQFLMMCDAGKIKRFLFYRFSAGGLNRHPLFLLNIDMMPA